MRQARIVLRPEGIRHPGPELQRSIMFLVESDDRLTTTEHCRPYETPIRTWMERTYPDDAVTEIWFSRPELLYWPADKPRDGQDDIVDGGVILRSGQTYRFRLELHSFFCHCAWCQDEPSVDHYHREWLDTLRIR